jgi:hypothetical protein
MPKGMSPKTRKDRSNKNKAMDTMKAGAAGLAGALAKIKALEERIKKMKTMSPGERKARTGSAIKRFNTDNMPGKEPNFRRRRKMLAEATPMGNKKRQR